MRIAVCSDEPYPVHDVLVAELERRGHEVVRFGSLASGREEPWAVVAEAAAIAVARGDCDEGVFACWTGTGICIAANKVAGVRAALCGDPETAAGARTWNHANVLCLSNRTLSQDLARDSSSGRAAGVLEILAAWFDEAPDDRGADGVRRLREVDARWRRPPGDQGSV